MVSYWAYMVENLPERKLLLYRYFYNLKSLKMLDIMHEKVSWNEKNHIGPRRYHNMPQNSPKFKFMEVTL